MKKHYDQIWDIKLVRKTSINHFHKNPIKVYGHKFHNKQKSHTVLCGVVLYHFIKDNILTQGIQFEQTRNWENIKKHLDKSTCIQHCSNLYSNTQCTIFSYIIDRFFYLYLNHSITIYPDFPPSKSIVSSVVATSTHTNMFHFISLCQQGSDNIWHNANKSMFLQNVTT